MNSVAKFGSYEDGFSVEKCRERFSSGHIDRDEFGGYSKKYYDPLERINRSKELVKSFYDLHKDTSIDTQTGGDGTAGYALVPVYPDPAIVDRTARILPFRAIVPRRAVRGLTYDYNALTAQGGASWKFENAAIPVSTDTYDRVSVGIKFLYAKGLISGPAIAAMRGFVDPTQLDLGSKTIAMYKAEEDALINGDATTNPEEPDGMIQLISTNTTNRSGGYPTLALIRAEYTTCRNANGDPTIAITDSSTHEYIKGLLQDYQRNTNPSKERLGFGIPGAFEYGGVLFIWDRYMPTTASSKRILFLDMRYIFFAVLQELTYEEKYTDADGWVYQLKEYLTIVNTFEASCSQMYGIA